MDVLVKRFLLVSRSYGYTTYLKSHVRRFTLTNVLTMLKISEPSERAFGATKRRFHCYTGNFIINKGNILKFLFHVCFDAHLCL
jgi:hypothetical protein